MVNNPLIPEVGVVALVADEWGQEWMSRHQILTRLAKYFHVVWVNPSPEWRQSLLRPTKTAHVSSALPSGFHLFEAEFWLPKFYRPRSLAEYVFRKRLNRARDLLLQRGCNKVILYIWRPEFAESLDMLEADLSCYHIVDEYTFSDVELPNSERERNLLRRVDQVFVHTQALLEKKRFAEFLRQLDSDRCGLRLLHYNSSGDPSTAREEVTIRAMDELSQRPNIHFLGHVTTAEMPFFPQHFDVCMMPYLLNNYTNYVYPLKLHEYLASGRPVIASPTRLLKEFEGPIQICHGVEEWSLAISKALEAEANSTAAREIRQSLARKHDWELLVKTIAQVFCQRLNLNCTEVQGERANSQEAAPLLSSCV